MNTNGKNSYCVLAVSITNWLWNCPLFSRAVGLVPRVSTATQSCVNNSAGTHAYLGSRLLAQPQMTVGSLQHQFHSCFLAPLVALNSAVVHSELILEISSKIICAYPCCLNLNIKPHWKQIFGLRQIFFLRGGGQTQCSWVRPLVVSPSRQARRMRSCVEFVRVVVSQPGVTCACTAVTLSALQAALFIVYVVKTESKSAVSQSWILYSTFCTYLYCLLCLSMTLLVHALLGILRCLHTRTCHITVNICSWCIILPHGFQSQPIEREMVMSSGSFTPPKSIFLIPWSLTLTV